MLKTNSLSPHILHVIVDKGTEQPFTGEYETLDESGTYLCRQCGLALFRSKSKFPSGCGWPSFDQEIPGTVMHKADADGRRMEILCVRCHAHLGHVFEGEGFTAKNIRHCVNSASLDFVSSLTIEDAEEIILAAGCFWGVEYFFEKLTGVIKTEVGYTGGTLSYPTYEKVCQGNTGHFEALRIVYDPKKISCEAVIKFFFEIHDPTQTNGQGPDIGSQYRSVIFYYDENQKQIAEKVMAQIRPVSTQLLPIRVFWPAEEYHQRYYQKSGHTPYCHRYTKRF